MKYRRPVLVTILLILTALLLILVLHPWNQPERGSRNIILRNTEDVDRIILVGSYHSTELIKENDAWYLFGTEALSQVSVENLLYAAGRLEVSSMTRAKENQGDNGEGEPGGDAREINFFKGDKVLLTYTLSVESGRYQVRLPGSETAYYVSLPGYPGVELERVFSANPDHYREHLLIDLRPSEISGISIELASGEAFRFTRDKKGSFRCDPANENTRLPDGLLNEHSMKLLFSYFTAIRFEQSTDIPADSLSGASIAGEKLATIGVESFSGETHSLRVFSYLEKPGSAPHLFKALVLFDDREEAVIVNYIYLDVLMRGLSHYFGEK